MMISCGKSLEKKSIEQNNQKDTLKVNIDVDLEIVKNGKIYNYNNSRQLDSFNGFLLKTSIKNLSNDTFKFYLFYCSYFYMFDFDPQIKIPNFICDYNPWLLYDLSQNEKMEIYTWIFDPNELWYFQNNSKLRIGFVNVNEEEEKQASIINILNYKLKNRKDIFWSNYVDFKEYIPTIKIETFKGNFIIKDSLENVLSIRSGEIH